MILLFWKCEESDREGFALHSVRIRDSPSSKSLLHAVICENGFRQARDFTIKHWALDARNLLPGLQFSRREVHSCLNDLLLAQKNYIGFARDGVARFPCEHQGFWRFVQKYAFEMRVAVETTARDYDVIDGPIFLGFQRIEGVLHGLSLHRYRKEQAGEHNKTR